MEQSLWRNKNFSLYILGRLVSLIGNGVLMLAMPLYVLDLTGQGKMMGLFGMLSLLPALVTMPIAGVLGDRLNRKHIMVAMDFANGLLLFAIFVITKMEISNLGFLMAFTVLLSIFSAIFNASTSAMLPDLVEENLLGKATSMRALVNSISFIIGPLLGGILYGFWGIEMIFLVDGISFLVSSFSEGFISYQPKREVSKIPKTNMLADIKGGFAFIGKHKNLKMLMGFALLTNLMMNPIFSVVYPYIMRKELGFSAQAYSFFETAFVVGMLLGNVVFVSLLSQKDTKVLMKTGLLAETCLLVVVAVIFLPGVVGGFGGPTYLFLAALIALVMFFGFSNVYVNVPFETNMQKMVPEELRSRVFAALGIISQGGVPLSTFVMGLALDVFKGYQINLIISVVCILVCVWFLMKAPDSLYRAELEEVSEKQSEGLPA